MSFIKRHCERSKAIHAMFGLLPALCFLAVTFVFTATLPAHAQDITTGLVGHWKLNETSGTAAGDSSGNGNDGTMAGGLMPPRILLQAA